MHWVSETMARIEGMMDAYARAHPWVNDRRVDSPAVQSSLQGEPAKEALRVHLAYRWAKKQKEPFRVAARRFDVPLELVVERAAELRKIRRKKD